VSSGTMPKLCTCGPWCKKCRQINLPINRRRDQEFRVTKLKRYTVQSKEWLSWVAHIKNVNVKRNSTGTKSLLGLTKSECTCGMVPVEPFTSSMVAYFTGTSIVLSLKTWQQSSFSLYHIKRFKTTEGKENLPVRHVGIEMSMLREPPFFQTGI
jgi:hypothetical protein